MKYKYLFVFEAGGISFSIIIMADTLVHAYARFETLLLGSPGAFLTDPDLGRGVGAITDMFLSLEHTAGKPTTMPTRITRVDNPGKFATCIDVTNGE